MAKPTDKAPEINSILDQILGQINPNTNGRERSIQNDICALCSNSAKEFRDDLSKKEYTISGMCQSCQDEFYGADI